MVDDVITAEPDGFVSIQSEKNQFSSEDDGLQTRHMTSRL
jgi:hypothetical protein